MYRGGEDVELCVHAFTKLLDEGEELIAIGVVCHPELAMAKTSPELEPSLTGLIIH